MKVDFRDIMKEVLDMRLTETARRLGFPHVARCILTGESSLGSPCIRASGVEDEPNRSVIPGALDSIRSGEAPDSRNILVGDGTLSGCCDMGSCEMGESRSRMGVSLVLEALESRHANTGAINGFGGDGSGSFEGEAVE